MPRHSAVHMRCSVIIGKHIRDNPSQLDIEQLYNLHPQWLSFQWLRCLVFVKVHWSPAVDLAVVISWEVLANQPSYPFVHRDKRYCPWSHLGGVLSSETDFSIGDACWLNWFWPALTECLYSYIHHFTEFMSCVRSP